MNRYIDSYDALDSLANYDMNGEDRKEAGKLIKQDLEILDILLKCVRVSTINYDDNDVSKSCNEFCFEFDELCDKEYLKLCKYLSKYIKLEVENE